MAQHERDAGLVALVETGSDRNVLDAANPEPLTLDTRSGRPVQFVLRAQNGPEAGIDLAITTDEPWLELQTRSLALAGGEAGEFGLVAKPGGDTKFANLLLFWESGNATLCQSVLIRRRLAAPASTPAPSSGSEGAGELERFIDGCGGPDKFIDTEEEYSIFRKGGALRLSLEEIEAALSRCCAAGGYSRQVKISEQLMAMLKVAAQTGGGIDEKEYGKALAFASEQRMPRRDAEEYCITTVLDNGWQVKEGVLNKWFAKKRKQFGL